MNTTVKDTFNARRIITENKTLVAMIFAIGFGTGMGTEKFFFGPPSYVICQKGSVTQCFLGQCPDATWTKINTVSQCP